MKTKITNRDIAMLTLLYDRCCKKFNVDKDCYNHFSLLTQNIIEGYEKNNKGNNKNRLQLDSTTVGKWWRTEEPAHWPNLYNRDAVAISLGYNGWKDFCNKERNLDTLYYDPRDIKIDELEVGEEVVLGWYPEHYAIFDFLGENKFCLKECSILKRGKSNASIQVGDQVTIYGFGISYIEHFKDIKNEGKRVTVGGFPLYPSLTYRTSPVDESQNIAQGVFILT